MNTKRTLYDGCAILVALGVLVITAVLLPSFWPIWLRALIGVLLACILFAIYLVARPPDQVIAMQRQLETIALNASKIKQAGNHLVPEARSLQVYLTDISTAIAQLAVKILRRELVTLETEVRRLESLSTNFLTLTKVLTGEVYLRPAELQKKVLEFRDQDFPEALKTIQELNVSLDESQAKQLASAEEELELLAALYDRNSAGYNAAEILRKVLEESPTPGTGGQNVT
jgi:hypothetical protein